MRFFPLNLRHIDKALAFVGGNRTAAAKLLDLTRDELNHAVNNNRPLREKWGLKKRGRPKEVLTFPISEYCPYEAARALQRAGLAHEIYSMSSQWLGVERVHELLQEELRRVFVRRYGKPIPPAPV